MTLMQTGRAHEAVEALLRLPEVRQIRTFTDFLPVLRRYHEQGLWQADDFESRNFFAWGEGIMQKKVNFMKESLLKGFATEQSVLDSLSTLIERQRVFGEEMDSINMRNAQFLEALHAEIYVNEINDAEILEPEMKLEND